MGDIIFLFGPSCSGKSSLSKALHRSLGSDWTCIDRDDLIEQKICSESEADKTLDERIQSIKSKLIIDTQLPWREKRPGELYFRLLPPLNVLLERDAARARKFQWSQEFAKKAREFVIHTYTTLSGLSKKAF
ncbi:MAG: hypothetical protein JWO53_1205, partial [Chlamydiia bacterium]|nr:hypothetical protein [Chlamydiia bacterium]